MDCSPPGFSVCGILQAAILEWVVMPSSRGSSWPRNWTCISCVSCIAGRVFTTEPLGKQKEGDPACLKQSFLFMIFLFQLLSVFKHLVFFAALWCSFPFARCGAAWFMNHLDLHMHSVEFCLLTILDPADVSKIKMSQAGQECRLESKKHSGEKQGVSEPMNKQKTAGRMAESWGRGIQRGCICPPEPPSKR